MTLIQNNIMWQAHLKSVFISVILFQEKTQNILRIAYAQRPLYCNQTKWVSIKSFVSF